MTTGEKQKDVEEFYRLMEVLRNKIGYHYLSGCDGDMGWPDNGVYFFFDNNEKRNNPSELRVVRVGTHGVSEGSKSTLWKRLRQHRGSKDGASGNHRGSVFRKLVGRSLIKRHNYTNCLSWTKKRISDENEHPNERFLEREVSKCIHNLPFLWIEVNGDAHKDNERADIEKKSIALLSEFLEKRETTSEWLGNDCPVNEVKSSGLWNSKHVKDAYNSKDGMFIKLLEDKIEKTKKLPQNPKQKDYPSST